jgi:chlorobactene glucosyltransferase
MVAYILQNQIVQIIIFQLFLLLFVLSNSWYLHRARKHRKPAFFPKISVLVPARNEEKNIHACIKSLLVQDYPSFEVLALDDQSSDQTLEILEEIASSNPELKVLVGTPPPENQAGKNWACTQLVGQAQGDLLFFTDADTIHQPQTLQKVVTALEGEGADMLTGVPHQEMGSWGERLLVPFFGWAFLCFTPLLLAYRLRWSALSSAVGQMMLFRRNAYHEIGGHAHLGHYHIDDLMLARRIKSAGLRWRVADITDLVSCRMYRGSRETFWGFSKNYFAAFEYRLLPYVFVYAWLAIMFWKPLILLVQLTFGYEVQANLVELLVCVGSSLLLWLTAFIILKMPAGLAFLYPVTILAVEVVALQSLLQGLTGRATWKARPISKARWKWV